VDGVKHKEICSELEDKSIPTVKIDAPNTKQGKNSLLFNAPY